MLFQKEKLKVRHLKVEDQHVLTKWLSDPFVLKYYEGRDNPFDLEKVNKEFFNPDNDSFGCIVEFEGKEIGYIQYYQLDEETRKRYGYLDKTENIYGTDQFIGEIDYWNRGIGSLLVKSMLEYLVEEKQADVVVMDPQIWNVRAIRCYEKCGFKRVKVLPKHELHEGEYRDCLLIEFKKR
ncbi:acetyltransferase [Pseudalkalibacillus decolorationis]|uniref:acetyltransferase n=1 Tax=Pseudalkalibacillus decolorationis TaxID=163879 RepID=UPI0021492413|nr:acetyltransferase [Pseudalkalibacillus decolorationis]